ncbi:carbohydrate sulfotransferase 4-like [Pecten maximus]|uniref:carbohydrate sulfotransferase 4-like n=1 Tax=Pecten maximus TaxID=6579 RepID=UPI0014588CED|nr:carbohydrate sulfotransferase 4-like [Pecten maximus]
MVVPKVVRSWCKVSVAGGILIYAIILIHLHFELTPRHGRVSDHVTAKTRARQLIILSHPRSGSSLTGDILQHATQSFYVFEPLHALENMLFQNITSMRLLNGNTVRIAHTNFISRSLEILEAYMTCNFRSLHYRFLIDGLHLMSHKHIPFLTCVDKVSKSTTNTEHCVNTCLALLETACQTSSFIVIKTVRMAMADLVSLMVRYSTLHLLHLVRDPRAVLYSKSKFGVALGINTHIKAKAECDSLLRDINNTMIYRERFPSRVETLYYETLAARPLETSEALYKQYGLIFTEEIRYHIYTVTSAGRESKCSSFNGLCLESSNSSKNSNLWKRQLSRKMIAIIDRSCNTLYTETNYFYNRMSVRRN